MDVAEFNNHWHVKGCLLRDIPVAGTRMYAYYDDGERSTVGTLDSTRYVVLSDPETSIPLAIIDEHWTYALRSTAGGGGRLQVAGQPPAQALRSRRRRHDGQDRARLPGDDVRLRRDPLHLAAAAQTRAAFAEHYAEKLGTRVVAVDTPEEAVRGGRHRRRRAPPPRTWSAASRLGQAGMHLPVAGAQGDSIPPAGR